MMLPPNKANGLPTLTKEIDNIPANLEFEYGEAIPWFNLPGNADQIKSSMKFQDLKPNIEILEVLKFDGKNKKWIKIK